MMNKDQIKGVFIKPCPYGGHGVKAAKNNAGVLACRTCGGALTKTSNWRMGRAVLVFFVAFVVFAIALTLVFALFGKGSVRLPMLFAFAGLSTYADTIGFAKATVTSSTTSPEKG